MREAGRLMSGAGVQTLFAAMAGKGAMKEKPAAKVEPKAEATPAVPKVESPAAKPPTPGEARAADLQGKATGRNRADARAILDEKAYKAGYDNVKSYTDALWKKGKVDEQTRSIMRLAGVEVPGEALPPVPSVTPEPDLLRGSSSIRGRRRAKNWVSSSRATVS